MNNKIIGGAALAAVLLALSVSGCASEKQQAEWQSHAKINKETAQAAALGKVPGGTVEDAEMSKWKGKLYWSFDIKPATGGEAIEVAVDPNSGEVVWMSNEKDQEEKPAAKISKETAMATALAKVPGGTVKDGELEKEKGKWIWSFDISIPDSKDIKEVAVDAITGEVIAVDTETEADQAKEAAEDAAKAKKKSEDKD